MKNGRTEDRRPSVAYYLSPLGWLRLESDGTCLTRIEFRSHGKHTKIQCEVLKETIAQLREYFAGTRKDFAIPIKLTGTDFQVCVWRTLERISFGKTVSYAELASLSGYGSAFRAVGNALGRNRLPIIIPCHRVLANRGKLGGFTGGIQRKKKLLEVERR